MSDSGLIQPADSLLVFVRQLADPTLADDAANEIWLRVNAFLRWKICGRIPDRHQAAMSEDDIALEAYEQFCRQYREGRLVVEDRGRLFGLLATIVVRRFVDRIRSLDAKIRNPAQRDVEAESGSAIIGDEPLSALLERVHRIDDESGEQADLGVGKAVVYADEVKRKYAVSHPADPNALDSQPGVTPLDRWFRDFSPFGHVLVDEVLDTLTEAQRELFVNLYVEQRTLEETADRMDLTLALVRRMQQTLQDAFVDLAHDSVLDRHNRRNRTRRAS